MGVPKPASCQDCDLFGHSHNWIPPGRVLPHTRLVVWGESGGSTEDQTGEGFTGASGRELRRWLKTAGLFVKSVGERGPYLFNDASSLESVAFRNVVACKPKGNVFPGDSVVSKCMTKHQTDLPAASQLPWLALGGNAIRSLTGFTLPTLKIRGSVLPALAGNWLVAGVHPAYLIRGGGYDNPDGQSGKSMDNLLPLLGVDAKRALTCCEPRIPLVECRSTPPEPPAPGTRLAVDIEGRDGKPNIVGVSWERGKASVMPWSRTMREWLEHVFQTCHPLYHNGAFDVEELLEAGVTAPKVWSDTINMAALYDPSLPKNLQFQVLTHVPGSVTWKGLVSHDTEDYNSASCTEYRRLWTAILTRLGRTVPSDGIEWYWFYNGLDAGWSLELDYRLQEGLEQQNRWGYYTDILQPLQKPLFEMGRRGMPFDAERCEHHRQAVIRLQRMAQKSLDDVGRDMLSYQREQAQFRVAELHAEREQERAQGARAFSKAKLLSQAQTKLRMLKTKAAQGFDIDSVTQRRDLLYWWLGLPEKRQRGAKGPSTDDETIEFLISQLIRGTIKVKWDKEETDTLMGLVNAMEGRPRTAEDAVRYLRALIAGKKWATWERAFLQPTAIGGRVRTSYSLHRTETGRIVSGMDSSDQEKGKRAKVIQLGNVPKKLRDIYRAEPGKVLVGADWAAIEWCLAEWRASKLLHGEYNLKLLKQFQAGELDPHRLLAAHIWCKGDESLVLPKQRRSAKGITFGYLFGGSAMGLSQRIQQPTSLVTRAINAHDAVFRLQTFRELTYERVKKNKYVGTLLGWRRYFWGWQPKNTEVLASDIQALAADLLKWVLVRIFRDLPENWEMLTTLHDANLLQVPEKEGEIAAQWLKGQMEQPIPWCDNLTFRVEVKVGHSWADV